VVSLYDAQVDAIKSRLGKKYDTCDGFRVRVKSIDGFQGEGVIIIASTVRFDGRPVAFLADNERTNVALTRARCTSISFCRLLLISVESMSDW
jgi:superfamily I DNA and/or RNA helicase